MSLSDFRLSKTWESAEDFPTYEDNEAKVRADIQFLFSELEDGLQTLIAELQKSGTSDGTAGANSLGIDPIAGLDGVTNVQSALAMLKQLINNIVIGDLPDGAVTTPKLANGAVTTPKLAEASVGEGQLKDGAVSGAKTDFSAGLSIPGRVEFGGKIILDEDSYGDVLPASAEEGRLFFLKAT